ncbi:MAG: hypothetical protein PHD48_08810 [Alphaproteobacteria bacterium]|nr:hypothetical protein [Alphaproteobacteria bacterium]
MNKYVALGNTLKMGLMASVLALALPELSFAQNTVGEILTTTSQTQVKPAATLIAALCYVGGSVSIISGALSLRKHADNPASEPMGKGITRLLVGAAIMSLPYLSGVLQETVFGDSNDEAQYTDFTSFTSD